MANELHRQRLLALSNIIRRLSTGKRLGGILIYHIIYTNHNNIYYIILYILLNPREQEIGSPDTNKNKHASPYVRNPSFTGIAITQP
jgi:hypothetical protein